MQNQFRSTENSKEIVNILNSCSVSLLKDFIWVNIGQTEHSNHDERQIFNIEKLIINEKFSTFQAVLEQDFFDESCLSQGCEVYVKLSYNDTVFKTRVLNLIGNVISFYFPKELMTKEHRGSPRHKFRPSENKHMTIKLNNELLSGAVQALKFNPIDISEKGAPRFLVGTFI